MMNADLLISVPYTWVLALSGVLLAIGILGVLLRRNAITIFLSLEIMLNSGTLAFAAFAMHFAAIPGMEATALNGQMFIFFIIAIAAAEAAVGLALFIALHRLKGSIDVDRANILRW
ncbi:MAG: NADH-quinone oxidoreductase subunit NuoK [Thermoanaerobaculales bacterium]|nr:NADH-quinone oxidoreductase subunit NuoK [Thermoanaerobaculales bacterium]